MAQISRAQCELCHEALDGGRVLCVSCSKQAWKARKTELQTCYLAASAADERAGASLTALRESEAFQRRKKLQDMQYELAVSRRRVANLKAHLDSLREKYNSCLLICCFV